jgi:hypothetical protein
MKKIVLVLVVFCLQHTTGKAQNTIVGKWKMEKMVFPELGEMLIDSGNIKEMLFKERVGRKKDTALTATDTTELEMATRFLYEQFSTLKIEYKVNKTYTAFYDKENITGTYTYDAASKTIITRPKNKPIKKTKIRFENGRIVIEDKKENLITYLIKVK